MYSAGLCEPAGLLFAGLCCSLEHPTGRRQEGFLCLSFRIPQPPASPGWSWGRLGTGVAVPGRPESLLCAVGAVFPLSDLTASSHRHTPTGGRLLAVTRVPSPPCQQPRRLLAAHRIAAIPTFFPSSRSVECCDVVTSVLPELCCKIRP